MLAFLGIIVIYVLVMIILKVIFGGKENPTDDFWE